MRRWEICREPADSYDGCPALAATNRIFAFLCALSDFAVKLSQN